MNLKILVVLSFCACTYAAHCELPQLLGKICVCQNVSGELDLECHPYDQNGMHLLGSNFPSNVVNLTLTQYHENSTLNAYLINSTTLQTLKFSDGQFFGFAESAFKGLPNLQNLLLIRNPGLASLPNNLVADLPNLQFLEIFGSNLKEIKKGVIAHGTNLKRISLSNLNLASLPNSVFSDSKTLNTLDLSSNHLREVKSLMFKGLQNLQYLNLSMNVNVTWFAKPFSYLTNLKTLKLNSMFYAGSSLPPTLFDGIPNLARLEMRQNGFENVPIVALKPMGENLKELSLDLNLFKTLDANSFKPLVQLEELSLESCQIRNISRHAFSGLSKLRVLVLNRNSLVHLSNLAFEHLTSLASLQLHDSQVKYIAPQAFQGLDNLISLNVTDNQLETLTEEVVGSVPGAGWEVYGGSEDDNPFKCNCSMLALLRWLEDQSKRMNIVCYQPKKLKSSYLTDLTEDDFDCRDPTIAGCCSKKVNAILGQDLSIQCIPDGIPKPEINFKVVSGNPFPLNRTEIDKSGTTLIIAKIDYSDVRTIQCDVTNILGSQKMTYDVTVTSFQPVSLDPWAYVGIVMLVVFVIVTVVLGGWLWKKRRDLRNGYEQDLMEEDSSVNQGHASTET